MNTDEMFGNIEHCLLCGSATGDINEHMEYRHPTEEQYDAAVAAAKDDFDNFLIAYRRGDRFNESFLIDNFVKKVMKLRAQASARF